MPKESRVHNIRRLSGFITYMDCGTVQQLPLKTGSQCMMHKSMGCEVQSLGLRRRPSAACLYDAGQVLGQVLAPHLQNKDGPMTQ